jgi:Type II secretion system (T2SS), protein M subtype b
VIERLSPRDRRTLAIGAAVVLALVLVARGLPAWRRWDAGTRASAAEMAAEAARAEQTVRLLPASLDSLQARRTRFIRLGGGVLEGESTAAAGASLAGLVSGAAAQAGVQIGSVQVRPDSASAGTFLRISVRADGTGDLPAITRMLGLLEGAPELLAVREISITQPNPGGPAEQAEALRLELAVEGLAFARPTPLPRDTTSLDDEGVDADSAALPAETVPAEGAP